MTSVLIADDSAVRRRIMSSVLEQAGYSILSAADGLEAVHAVYRDRPDLVIVDAQMPRLSGFIVTRLLKDDRGAARIPVIIIASGETASESYWGHHAGADGVLSYDFSPGKLLSVVHDLAGAPTYLPYGQPLPGAPPLHLDDDEVLARVSELLERKLFEASLQGEITSIALDVHSFEPTIAKALGVVSRIMSNDLAAIYLTDTRALYIGVSRPTSSRQYHQLCASIADVATNLGNQSVIVSDLVPRIADRRGYLGADDEGAMATFMWLPLHSHDDLVGCMALSSARPNAFGESGIDTLRLISSAAASVIGSARAADRSGIADVA